MLEQVEPAPPDPAGIWPRLRELGGQSGLYLVADALSKGLALLLLPLYLHYLTPADYGILAIVLTVTVLLTIVLSLALQGSIQRIYFELDTDDERRTLYATVLAFLVVVPGIAVLGLELLGRAGALDLFRTVPYDPYLRLALLTAYLSVFREIPVAIYTVRGEARKVLALLLFNAALLAALTVALVVGAEEGAIGAVRAALIASAILAVVSVALTMREAHLRVSWQMLKISLLFGVPLVPHLVGHWVLTLADRSVLDRFVTADDIGIYALGANIALGAFLFATALGRAFTPALTRELKAPESTHRVPLLGTWWVAALVWCCTAIAVFAGPLIHIVFDEQYAGAISIVPWLVGGYLALGMYNVVTQGTWFSMRVRWVPVLTLIAGAVNVGLAILLVPAVGSVGAAVATMVGFIALAIMQGMLSQRLFPIAWEYGRWAKLLLAGGIAYAFGHVIGEGAGVVTLLLKALAVLALLPAVLLATRFFTASELSWLRARLGPLSA